MPVRFWLSALRSARYGPRIALKGSAKAVARRLLFRSAMSATAFLRRQHEEIADLFAALESSGSADRKDRFLELACMLVGHDRLEREIFYPVCEEAMGMVGERCQALIEHGAIKLSLYEVSDALGQADFHSKLAALKTMVEQHIAEEEQVFFPQVEQGLDQDSLEFLTGEMLQALEESPSSDPEDARLSA
jgi:iron-sulfur cluster repair protein YtfE (RIC family)